MCTICVSVETACVSGLIFNEKKKNLNLNGRNAAVHITREIANVKRNNVEMYTADWWPLNPATRINNQASSTPAGPLMGSRVTAPEVTAWALNLTRRAHCDFNTRDPDSTTDRQSLVYISRPKFHSSLSNLTYANRMEKKTKLDIEIYRHPGRPPI